jgi:hypothetical protein
MIRWVGTVLATLCLAMPLAAQEAGGTAGTAPAADAAAPTEPAPAADAAPSAGDGATEAPAGGIVAGAVADETPLTEVETGMYVLRLLNVSPRDGTFEVDAWIWFRWLGSDVRPDLSFELANGVVSNRTDSEVEIDGGKNFATLRFQGVVYQDFDLRRYPLDNHVLTIEIEDANLDKSSLIYKADGESALDPAVKVAGWEVALQAPAVDEHVYPTSYGYVDNADSSTYSRFTLPVSLERTSWGQLIKQFWASVLAVALGLLAFFVKSDDLDARFGLGVGSIFAASANAFVISGDLPKTSNITLAEQLNLIAVGVIFLSVFVSIWSLRLRYLDREEDSLALDRTALVVLAVLFVAATGAALAFELDW